MSNLIEQIADEVVHIKLASTKDFLSRQEVITASIYLWRISFLIKSHKEMIGNSTIQFSSCNHEKLWNTAKEEETKLVATDHTGSLTSEYMKIIRCIILVDSISDRVIW